MEETQEVSETFLSADILSALFIDDTRDHDVYITQVMKPTNDGSFAEPRKKEIEGLLERGAFEVVDEL